MSKENKLELKHITPYLPYGLQILRPDGNTVLNVVGLSINGIVTVMEDCQERYCSMSGIRPMLRPMSDVYKPLDGGSAPIVELAKLGAKIFGLDFSVCHINKYEFTVFSNEGYEFGFTGLGFYLLNNKEDNADISQLELFNYLFEHHFDVFGLIDKGLAVDVNEIPF